jgi:hypothetical protein
MTRRNYKKHGQKFPNQPWFKLFVISGFWIIGLSITFEQHIKQSLSVVYFASAQKQIKTTIKGPLSDALSNNRIFSN